jgi:hypothetical protein
MRWVVIISASLIATTSSARAMSDSDGAGMVPCAVYAKSYQQQPEMTDLVYGSWLDGFLTGFNGGIAAHNQQFQRIDLSGMDRSHRNDFTRDYCNRNPLSTFMQGALELMAVLPRIPKGQ